MRWNARFATFLGLTCLAFNAVAAQQGKPNIVTWSAADPLIERKSGEVQVRSTTVLWGPSGQPYTVTLAFPDIDTYHRALAVAHNGIDLGELGAARWKGKNGKVVEVVRPGAQDLIKSADTANRSLCSDVVALGTAQLADDVFVGVRLHSVALGQYAAAAEDDIFGDCDTWAAGGCGGENGCWDGERQGGTTIFGSGDCVEVETWGPNGCACDGLSVES